MVDTARTRAIALSFPGAVDESSETRLVFSVNERGFAWSFMQRDAPRQPRWSNIEVLAICCPLDRKELLLEIDPDVFFTDPHYNGYPAILVRLPVIDEGHLTELLHDAHALQAAKPKKKPYKKRSA